jgi:peptide/nickel transport system permease protein
VYGTSSQETRCGEVLPTITTVADLFRFHVAPQCVASFLVLATTHLGVAIIIEAALGYLGIPPPTPTWGNMLAMQSNTLIPQWWLVIYPRAAISVVVLAFSLFGDSL